MTTLAITATTNPDLIKWLSPQRAGTFMGKSRRTIYSWLQAGKLHYRRGVNNLILIDAASLWEDYSGPRTPWVSKSKAAGDQRPGNLKKGPRGQQTRQRAIEAALIELVLAVETGSDDVVLTICRAREALARAD